MRVALTFLALLLAAADTLSGISLIAEAKNPKLVILILSDGEETGSVTPFGEMVKTRRQSETQVYAVRTEQWPLITPGIPSPQAPSRPNVLPHVVGDSGAVVYNVQIEPHAARTAQALLDELRSQYLLGYLPSRPPDGKYRRVKLETNDKTLRVRHRAGYLAMPVTP